MFAFPAAPAKLMSRISHQLLPTSALTITRLMKTKSVRTNFEEQALYGLHPVRAAIDANRRKINQLLIDASVFESGKYKATRADIQQIYNTAKKRGFPVVLTKRGDLDRICSSKPHQGVILQCEEIELQQQQALTKEFSKDVSDARVSRRVWLLLDRVQDTHNMGSILRSAFFFGVDRILCSPGCAPLSPAVGKSSAGAVEWLDVHAISDVASLLKDASTAGWDVVGTQGRTQHRSIPDINETILGDNVILCLGNEGSGLSRTVLGACSKKVCIPTRTEVKQDTRLYELESLNVAVAAGILLQWCTAAGSS
eukprot:m.203799 g.203799  ORF g.203799 m.203799 type:complete len:311 (-) comp18862_c0_seq1:192-1124(-)